MPAKIDVEVQVELNFESNRTVRVKTEPTFKINTEGKFVCEADGCGKVLANKKCFTQHARLHDENLQRFECSLCQSSFSRKGRLDKHVRNEHKKLRSSFIMN